MICLLTLACACSASGRYDGDGTPQPWADPAAAHEAAALTFIAPLTGSSHPAAVRFKVSAPVGTARVDYWAGPWQLGSSGDASAGYGIKYVFTVQGQRTVTARAYDFDGAQLAATSVGFLVQAATETPQTPAQKHAAVADLLKKKHKTMTGKGGCTIAHASLAGKPGKPALVILPGRTEPYLKYYELAYDLRALGHPIYLMDHRGQGKSCRMLSDRQRGHVEDFFDYMHDLRSLLSSVVRPAGHKKVILLGHSMGGAVATLLAQRYPAEVHGLVLSSPMLRIDTGNLAEWVAHSAANANCLMGKGGDYAPGQKPYNPAATFSANQVTHSAERFALYKQVLAANSSLAVGGATNRWVKEALEETWDMQKKGSKIKAKVLMLQAGEDRVVKNSGQDRVCAAAPSCKKLVFAGAYHELLMERDVIRDAALKSIKAFLGTL